MRRSLLINLSLAVVWTVVTGSFTAPNLLMGFVVGYLVMRLLHPLIDATGYVGRMWHVFEFAVFFVHELIVASGQIVVDVVTPTHRMEPGVIAFPLDVKTSAEITLLANVISLTPGTLSLDVSEDWNTLFIHVMYLQNRDVEAERERIKRSLESRVRNAIGPSH